MELGGVGRPALDFFVVVAAVGAERAATVAKLSLPAQKSVSSGLEGSTGSVIPAKARAMLEVFLLPVGAMVDVNDAVLTVS